MARPLQEMDEIAKLTRKNAYIEDLPVNNPCGHIRDCGCEGVADCCFDCPLPRCRYDGPRLGRRFALNAPRNAELARRWAAGDSMEELIEHFQLGRRTIFRILQEAK